MRRNGLSLGRKLWMIEYWCWGMTATISCLVRISLDARGEACYFNEPWYEKSYKHDLTRMLSRFGVFSLDFGSSSILWLADLPSSENMFCPPPTWTWHADKPYSRKHDHWEGSRSTLEPTTKRRKMV
ncbi:hypothetical protein ACFX2I_032511 [Malus domestica]